MEIYKDIHFRLEKDAYENLVQEASRLTLARGKTVSLNETINILLKHINDKENKQ